MQNYAACKCQRNENGEKTSKLKGEKDAATGKDLRPEEQFSSIVFRVVLVFAKQNKIIPVSIGEDH